MSVCVCKMTQITQIHLFLLRVFVSPLPARIRVFCLRSEAENLADCDFSKQHMFVTGCCEDFVLPQQEQSNGNSGRGAELETVAGKRPHETGRNGFFFFFFFFSGFWPFCTQKVNMMWSFHISAVTVIHCTEFTSQVWFFFVYWASGWNRTNKPFISLLTFSLKPLSACLWFQFNFIYAPQWTRFYAFLFYRSCLLAAGSECQSKVRVSLIVMKQQSPQKVALVPKM